MLKKILVSGMLVIMMMTLFVSSALAVEPGEQRVTLGANLTEEQIDQIYKDFGVERGTVTEIVVTNDEERKYLSGLVPDKKIGSVALSCIYITTLDEGTGISVSTNNINWCTVDMYVNALITAGVENASVKVSAPRAVSGTAALTGIYKAYEDITGVALDQTAKEAAAEELVVTGELAESIGSENATELINELKKILDQTKQMTDEELRAEILKIAAAKNIELTEDQIRQIISLCRTLEQIDASQWADKLSQLGAAMKTVQEAGAGVSSFFESVGDFFVSVGDFFVGIFKAIGDFFSGLFG